jgi:hypothetical protein
MATVEVQEWIFQVSNLKRIKLDELYMTNEKRYPHLLQLLQIKRLSHTHVFCNIFLFGDHELIQETPELGFTLRDHNICTPNNQLRASFTLLSNRS